MRAIWNGTVLAESEHTVVVEGNHYFPPDSVRRDVLLDSTRQTRCHWKGTASYYDISVGGKTNRGGAFTYRDPSAQAAQIRDHVAFWQGVVIEESRPAEARA